MNTKCAIMQPYLFPYLGYFKLVSEADIFVFLDDVTYIKQGWINRNRILDTHEGKVKFFSFPLVSASSNRYICETELFDFEKNRSNFLKTLEYYYGDAPYFEAGFALTKSILEFPYKSISELASESVIRISRHLEVQPQFLFSSQLRYDRGASKTDRLANICKLIGANTYINSPGGTLLYNAEDFLQRGIELQFVSWSHDSADELGVESEDQLSIVHGLMKFHYSDLATKLRG